MAYRGRKWKPRHVRACPCGWWGVRTTDSFDKPCPVCFSAGGDRMQKRMVTVEVADRSPAQQSAWERRQ